MDGLNEEFEKIKEELKITHDHPTLNLVLDKVFKHIDRIEKEYRDFHAKNCSIPETHPDKIKNCFF